jgi:hypothetical protein
MSQAHQSTPFVVGNEIITINIPVLCARFAIQNL